MTHEAQHRHADHHSDDKDSAVLAEMLDLDAQVLGSYLAGVTGRVRDLAGDRAVLRIADLGCGTGSGGLALAEVFGSAEVVAVDQSTDFLAHVVTKARDRGLADRVQTVAADLDQAWPALSPVDLVWMSMSLHHLADPEAGLAEIYSMLSRGGLLAVAEMSAQPLFLPDDVGLGEPGLEARCRVALAELMAEALPHLGADWGPRLAEAGFSSVTRQDFDIALDSPLPPAAGRYAQLALRRQRGRLEGVISADDLAVLDVLISDDGPLSVLHRQDLAIRGTRTLWTGRRP